MSPEELQKYLIPALIIGFFIWRFTKNKRIKKMMPDYRNQGAIVVDVRSSSEYAMGSSAGSLNIPLDQLGHRLNELDREKTIILCCASGARSGMAAGVLKANGFKNVINAGSWMNTMV